MATLSSTSTDSEVLAAYDDNAGYDEDDSTTKASAFVTACRIMLRRMARSASKGGASFTANPDQVYAEMLAAKAWRAARDTTNNPQVILLGVTR